MSAGPGILYVTMQPKPGLAPEVFHEWYNNEHGPTRLRIPQIFTNGFRYRAADGQQPTFMAIYDVTSMDLLETDTYTSLRAQRSAREADTIGQVDVKRFFYDLRHTKASALFTPIEGLSNKEAEGFVTVAVEIRTKDLGDAAAEYEKWYIDEHVELLAKVPGWLRSRLFKTSSVESPNEEIFLCLHDYAQDNGLGGNAHKASMDTPWRTRVFDNNVSSKDRRTFSLFYLFGPASRDLQSLSKLNPSAAFTSPNSSTATVPGTEPTISSYVTTKDGLVIPYLLEGNAAPGAPVVAFSNSLLTSLHMWDPLVAILKKHHPELCILRYDTRGRHAIPQPPVAASLETVTDDIITVLEALRITKLHTLIGVSLGGATTLNFALKYPSRLDKFIACDFNCLSSPANTQAWKDRIVTAREDAGKGIAKLADQTVARWFHPSSMENNDTVRWITGMVAANNVEGFAHSCTALWDYDQKPKMGSCSVPGLLVVGEGDAKGAVPKAMDGFKALIGDEGIELKIVPNVGHLPMCEAPGAFWKAIRHFL